jgi:hypothetical protein
VFDDKDLGRLDFYAKICCCCQRRSSSRKTILPLELKKNQDFLKLGLGGSFEKNFFLYYKMASQEHFRATKEDQ